MVWKEGDAVYTNGRNLAQFLADNGLAIEKSIQLPLNDIVARCQTHALTRSYGMRPLYPRGLERFLAEKGNPAALRQLVIELFAVYVYRFTRSIEANRVLNEEHTILLYVFMNYLKANKYVLKSSDLRYLNKYCTEHLSEKLKQAIELALISQDYSLLNESKITELTKHILMYLGNKNVNAKRYNSDIMNHLVDALGTIDTVYFTEKLDSIIRNYIDIYTGLFVYSHGQLNKKYFFSPLILILLAKAIILNFWNVPEGSDDCVFKQSFPGVVVPVPDSIYEPRLPDEAEFAFEASIIECIVQEVEESSGSIARSKVRNADTLFSASLRFDVDRKLDMETCKRIIAFEDTHGLTSSWFFLRETYEPVLVEYLTGRGREVGWHVCHGNHGDRGFAGILKEQVTGLGQNVIGCTFHGGLGSEYFQGLSSLEHAVQQGMDYAEMPLQWFPQPVRVGVSGGVLFLFPLSVKYDAHPEWLDQQMELIRRYRGHAVLEMHPDRFSMQHERFIVGELEHAAIRRLSDHMVICREFQDRHLGTCDGDA